jgi:type IX secretion system PorP/SprF family membrane protein
MRRTLFITLFIILGNNFLFAQQEPLFTQYMFNPLPYNPAIAGTNNYYQIRLNSRFQWAGITDAPVTNCLSAYGPGGGKNKDMGFGGYIVSDVTGPTSRTGFYGAYAYNIAMNNEIRLSMGLALGLLQYKIDGSKISTADPNDPIPVLQGGSTSLFLPDASMGVYLYASNFQVGFSAVQLLNNKLKLYSTGLSKLTSNYYLTGGYKYFFDRDWAVEPTALIKAVGPVPLQMDLSAKVIYQSQIWGALAYRTGDAISIIIGYAYQKKIYVGYSYDFGISDIHKYQSGSHEIMINYHFQTLK